MTNEFTEEVSIFFNKIREVGIISGGTDNKNIYLYLNSPSIDIYHLFDEQPKIVFDYFGALFEFRKLYPQYKLGLKGCLVNVWPSSMCRDLGNGLIAYYLNIGQSPTDDDIIHVFSKIDRDDFDLIASPIEQQQFYYKWLESL